ncbi:GAF domain-containing protein [Hymenobacter perfusus]|uniref:GAF domain-containing protein n=1 Tax=Hymenobacter perfusus TaxID=1236770 RepID=A0A3R9MND7_9BACT|nr:GAF domain-containing protein [Hymenobacter perfusus]RSK44524.1 GAF domain-containing protein [Hymenobacter perfusus]
MDHLPDSLIPADDISRLRSLHHYQVLNTTPEPVFDEYVALAAQLFQLPISLLSLVDEQEVFFKANIGLPGLERVARPDSLCSAAILQGEVLSYADLATEGCNLVNPYVAQAAGLRFYAGAALHMPDGSNIGSLCVMGREPRSIEPDERVLLTTLARLLSLTIELRRHYLGAGRQPEWLAAQQELQALLTDEAAMARYLTSQPDTPSANEAAPVRQRLLTLRRVLEERLAEFAPPAAG